MFFQSTQHCYLQQGGQRRVTSSRRTRVPSRGRPLNPSEGLERVQAVMFSGRWNVRMTHAYACTLWKKKMEIEGYPSHISATATPQPQPERPWHLLAIFHFTSSEGFGWIEYLHIFECTIILPFICLLTRTVYPLFIYFLVDDSCMGFDLQMTHLCLFMYPSRNSQKGIKLILFIFVQDGGAYRFTIIKALHQNWFFSLSARCGRNAGTLDKTGPGGCCDKKRASSLHGRIVLIGSVCFSLKLC